MASGLSNLRFRCTECGNCCRTLRVPITHRDLQRLVGATGRAPESLVDWLAPDEVNMTGEPETFVMLREGRRLMVLAHFAGACRHLSADNRCEVHAARPATCRTYPFDIELGRRNGVRRLRLLKGIDCRYDLQGENPVRELVRDDALRWSEHDAFVQKVRAFNRTQIRRQRLGRLSERAASFFAFLAADD